MIQFDIQFVKHIENVFKKASDHFPKSLDIEL